MGNWDFGGLETEKSRWHTSNSWSGQCIGCIKMQGGGCEERGRSGRVGGGGREGTEIQM